MKSRVSLSSTSPSLNHLRILFERFRVQRSGWDLRYCFSIKPQMVPMLLVCKGLKRWLMTKLRLGGVNIGRIDSMK